MSKYTTQLRWIIEENADPTAKTISEKIDSAAPKIFNFSYPIWVESYRPTLERKILMHYFNKEIAMETVGLWKFYLEEKLNLIMPYYNELYQSTVQQFDMLSDVDYTESLDRTEQLQETGNEDVSGNTTTNNTINSTLNQDHAEHANAVRSDYPQAQIGMTDYATDASETNGTSTANDTSNSTEDGTGSIKQTKDNTVTRNISEGFTRTRKGMTGRLSYPELINQYRSALLNIDNLVIDELYDLFMLLY